jgi:hypothetical protein
MVNRHIELTEEQNETLERLAASQGRPVAELIRAGVDVVLSRGASILPFERNSPVLAPSLSEKESELLLAINRSLPAAKTQQYQELTARRRAETLNPMEHQELLDLTDDVERLQAERIEHLAELAHLRGKPLGVLMEELGIRPSPNE